MTYPGVVWCAYVVLRVYPSAASKSPLMTENSLKESSQIKKYDGILNLFEWKIPYVKSFGVVFISNDFPPSMFDSFL